MLEGLDYEPGSVQETLAILALERRHQIEYMKTFALCQASAGDEGVQKTLKRLLGMLIPELAEQTERQAERIMEKLDDLTRQGPLYVSPMDSRGYGTRRKRGVEA